MSDPETPKAPAPEAPASGLGDAPMRAAVWSVFLCGLCFAVIAAAVVDFRTALSVLAGGLIATANLMVFARVGQAILSGKERAAPWAAVAFVKLTLLFGGVWILLKSGYVTGIPLAAGYAALPFGIVIGTLLGPKPPEDLGDGRGRP